MKDRRGFTLIETLAALTITLILGAVTVQGLHALLDRSRDDLMLQEMVQFLKMARSQADVRHRTISVCASSDQQRCGGNWSDGQLMFIDDAENGVVTDASQVIAVHQMKAAQGEVVVRFYPHYRRYLQFQPLLSDNNDNGSLWFCRVGVKQPAWGLVLNKEGRVRVLNKGRDGNIKGADGHLLNCTPT